MNFPILLAWSLGDLNPITAIAKTVGDTVKGVAGADVQLHQIALYESIVKAVTQNVQLLVLVLLSAICAVTFWAAIWGFSKFADSARSALLNDPDAPKAGVRESVSWQELVVLGMEAAVAIPSVASLIWFGINLFRAINPGLTQLMLGH